ncbi:hypothetical protein CRG98_019179 [Punica granatum]|uniref:Uncharacterized protein n=1 Tax=Punica granatum TaxID=22663 RepID=A0A2I0JVT9_PUNGR|nr:hypothetical protein CRG98_019179 [Punica granatum]
MRPLEVGSDPTRAGQTRLDVGRPRLGAGRFDWAPRRKQSTPRNRPDWASLESDITTVTPNCILLQGQWLSTLKRPPEVTVVVVWRARLWIDPNLQGKVKLPRLDRPDWQKPPNWAGRKEMAFLEAPGGSLLQGRRLPTPKRPPEVASVVVWRKKTQVDPRKKKKTAHNGQTRLAGIDPTRTSGKELVVPMGWRLQMKNLSLEVDLGGPKYVEVW